MRIGAARLSRDAENELASGAVKVLLGRDQPHGFTFTAAQLNAREGIWVPAYDVFITLEDHPISFEATTRRQMKPFQGKRSFAADCERTRIQPTKSTLPSGLIWEARRYMHPHQVAAGSHHLLVLGQRHSQIRDRSWSRRLERLRQSRSLSILVRFRRPDARNNQNLEITTPG